MRRAPSVIKSFAPWGWSLNDVLGDGYVEPLQLRHPEPGLSYYSSRNFSEKLEVVRVDLLKHSKSASCPYKVDASAWRVKLQFVGAVHAFQRNHFSHLRIHDDHLPRFILVSALYPATKKQAVMAASRPAERGTGPPVIGHSASPGAFSSLVSSILNQFAC